jgi:Putative adhesin
MASQTFETPNPIAVALAIGVGDIRITAGERRDTVVTISPGDPAKKDDLALAKATRVEYSEGQLLIRTPRSWKQYTPFGGRESIDVLIELPAGSRLDGEAALADLSCDGRLGECRFTTGAGHIQLDEAGSLHLSTGAGRVTVGRALGRTEITGSGQLRVREIEGPAVLKNLNGATWVGLVTGDLRCNSANGDISVDRALAAVEAKTANGDVRVGEVVCGSIELGTSYGQLEIGIREGTAALLDVASKFGSVRNSLTASEGPGTSDQTIQVRARSSFGDIVIRRSTASSVEVEKQ